MSDSVTCAEDKVLATKHSAKLAELGRLAVAKFLKTTDVVIETGVFISEGNRGEKFTFFVASENKETKQGNLITLYGALDFIDLSIKQAIAGNPDAWKYAKSEVWPTLYDAKRTMRTRVGFKRNKEPGNPPLEAPYLAECVTKLLSGVKGLETPASIPVIAPGTLERADAQVAAIQATVTQTTFGGDW